MFRRRIVCLSSGTAVLKSQVVGKRGELAVKITGDSGGEAA